jgi:hypothetical protein
VDPHDLLVSDSKIYLFNMSKSAAKDSIDGDLLDIINRLHKIQQEVGGGDIKKAEEKKVKLDRFVDMQKAIEERLESLRDKMELTNSGELSNPRDVIENKSAIRSDITSLGEEWNELNLIYMNESKKKKV